MHVLAFQDCLRCEGVKGQIDPLTLDFLLDVGGKQIRLYAQFVGRTPEGRYFYSRTFSNEVQGFVGWSPYKYKKWEVSTSKLAFKEFAEFNGFSTPRHARSPSELSVSFLVKPREGSFGYGIRGPFLPQDAHLPEAQLRGGAEFYEEFILGKIARAWYWNDTLVVLEVFEMPRVVGDGRHTVRELVQNITSEDEVHKRLPYLARLQGVSSDDVLPAGAAIVVEYRYVSPLTPTLLENCNAIEEVRGTLLHQVLVAAGKTFWKAIPKDIRPNTAFVLDAVLDEKGKPYFLEMNCNPQFHPDLYPVMLQSLARPY